MHTARMSSMESQATTVAQSDSSQETYAGTGTSFGMCAGSDAPSRSDAPSHDHGDKTTPTLRDPRDWQTFQSLEVCAEYLEELRENLQPSPRGSVDSAPQTIDDRLRDAIRCDRRVVQIVDVDENLAHTECCVFSRFRWRMEHGLIQMAYGNGCDANKHIPIRLPVMQKVRRRGGTAFYVHSVCRRCTACCFLHIDILAGSEPLAPVHGDMIQELKETVTSLQQTVSTIKRTVDDHSTSIEGISSASAPAANGDIEMLQSSIATCSRKVEIAMTTLGAQAARIDSIAATNQTAHGTLHALAAKVNSMPLSFPFYSPYNNAFNAANAGTGAPPQTTQAISQAPQSFASILQPSGSAQHAGNVPRSMPQPTSSSLPDSIFLQNIPATDAQQSTHRSSDKSSSTPASSALRHPDPPPSPGRSAAQAMLTMANSEPTRDSHARAGKRARGT